MKKIALIFGVLFMVSCSGGGYSSSGGDNSAGGKNLSYGENLKGLYHNVAAELQKGEDETTSEYETRIADYAATLTDYYSIYILDTEYNANTHEMKIDFLPWYIADNVISEGMTLRFGDTELEIVNNNILPRESDCYKTVIVDPKTAKKIADGFRVEYTYAFPLDVVRYSYNTCDIGYYMCTSYLYGIILTYRVYNVVDGKEY